MNLIMMLSLKNGTIINNFSVLNSKSCFENLRISDEMLHDTPQISSYLSARVPAKLMEVEDDQILGGNGYINEYATGRLLRDAKLYEIGAGTSEIRRMLIGRELFTESR